MNLKRELQKKLIPRADAKKRVWEKIQQPVKKSYTPYWVTVALLVLGMIFIATNITKPVQNTVQERSQQNIASSRPLIFNIVSEEGQKPEEMHNDHAIFVAQNEREFAQFESLFQLPSTEVDFTKHDVVIVQFISDGCGLVVDALYKEGEKLLIALQLPEPLRSQKELACTSIAEPHTVLLQMEKLSVVNNAQFVQGETFTDATLNRYDVYVEEQPLIRGYVVKEQGNQVLITESELVTLTYEVAFITEQKALLFEKRSDLKIGSYVTIYGTEQNGIGTIRECAVMDEVTVHGANSTIQPFVKKALNDKAVKTMGRPFVTLAYFDKEKKQWAIQIVDGEDDTNAQTFHFNE